MNEKRVFGPLTCVAEGWKWNFDLIFPFQKTVHVEAKCVKGTLYFHFALINSFC